MAAYVKEGEILPGKQREEKYSPPLSPSLAVLIQFPLAHKQLLFIILEAVVKLSDGFPCIYSSILCRATQK